MNENGADILLYKIQEAELMHNRIIDSMMGDGFGGPLGFMSYYSIILTVEPVRVIAPNY